MPDKIVQIVKKYDEALIEAESEKYILSIQMSLDGFLFCIFDDEKNKFLSIEAVEFSNVNRIGILTEILKQFVLRHPWVTLRFKTVNIIYETSKSTLVPSPLFDKTEKETFTKFNFTIEESHDVKYDKLNNLDAFILYTFPVQLKETVNELFPKHKLLSHSGVLIESILVLHKNLPEQKRAFVNVRNSYLDIIVTEGRKLLYYNSFDYKTKEDFVYFLIFVLEQLNLNPEEIDLVISGFIDKNSELFEIIYKYVRNVHFQALTASFKYSYIFNEIPSHYYFNLLNFGLCEL